MSVQALTVALSIKGVTSTEKLILMLLANYADEHMRCWPSHRRLADESCLSERTILTTLKGLEAAGFITRTERQRPDGSRASDIITLHMGRETISPRGEIDAGGVGKPLRGGGEMVSPLTTFEPSIEPSKKNCSPDDGFEAWWDAYPKKVAKGSARKAYGAALKKISPEALLGSLAGRDWGDPKFIPHPATWLNAERWLDDAGAGATQSPSAPADPWPSRMRGWVKNQYWNSEWGPRPGKPGCKAPITSTMERAA